MIILDDRSSEIGGPLPDRQDRPLTRRRLLRASATLAIAGIAAEAGLRRAGGSILGLADQGLSTPTDPASILDIVVTDSPFGTDDARNVTDRAAVPLIGGDEPRRYDLVNNLAVHRFKVNVRSENRFAVVGFDVFAHGERKRSMELRVREDLGLRRLWLGRDYVHWDAGQARFPALTAAKPFYDEVWFATPAPTDGGVRREGGWGYGYDDFEGSLGFTLQDGYRYTFAWTTQPDNVGRDYRIRWSRGDEVLVETIESVYLLPGGVGLFFPIPTANYLWSDALAYSSPKPAAWACCAAGLS